MTNGTIAMNNFLNIFNQLRKRRFLKFGLPFFVFVLGGSFGLREFSKLKYQYSNKAVLRPEEVEKATGKQMKKRGDVTMESEYEKISKMDIDNWENIRGPRPWEENTYNK